MNIASRLEGTVTAQAPVRGPTGRRSGSILIRPNPFGPDPKQLPAMLLYIYDPWELLIVKG
jgi:hypothetical protein